MIKKDNGLEFNRARYTLTGEYDPLFSALVREKLAKDGTSFLTLKSKIERAYESGDSDNSLANSFSRQG